MTSPFGYNVIGQGETAREHLLRLRPRVMFYMNAWQEAIWCARNLPDTLVIHRIFAEEEADMHMKPGRSLQHLKERVAEKHKEGAPWSIYINLYTEPYRGTEQEFRNLCREALDCCKWAVANNIRLALPHGAFYGVEHEWQYRLLEPLTTYIAEHPELLLFTVDEYFGGHAFSGVVDNRLPEGAEFGHIQPETWLPSPEPKYYHKGSITNYFRWLVAHGKPVPLTVITEDGADDLNDIDYFLRTLIVSPGYHNIRGWRTLTEQWRQWYGPRGWSPEKAFVEMLVAIWKAAYAPWPQILGSCLYCWGTNNDPQWLQFRLDEADAAEFRALLEQANFGSVPMPRVEKPADAGTPVKARLSETYKLRDGNGTSYADLGSIPAGTQIDYYPATKRAGGSYDWVFVEALGKSGWMAYGPHFIDLPTEIPPTVKLEAPFRSQHNTGNKNNCGPAMLSTILAYELQSGHTPSVQEINQFLNKGDAFEDVDDLLRASVAYGVPLERATYSKDLLTAQLDQGHVVGALVTRGNLKLGWGDFTGNHFVTVVGYGEGYFLIHDPYGGGGYAPRGPFEKVTVTNFENALINQRLLVVAPPKQENWRDLLDERQRREVEFSEVYARQFNHGTPGALSYLTIASLASLLDQR